MPPVATRAPLRLLLAPCSLAVLALLLVYAGGRQQAGAQGVPGQPVVFVGTIRDSIGAPPPPFSTVKLVLTPASPAPAGAPPTLYCALGATDPAGNFQLQIHPFAAACTMPGTVLSLLINGVAAVQTTSIPATGGVYSVTFTTAVPLGGVVPATATAAAPLPQPPSQATTPAPAPHTTVLATGCSLVILSLGAGATPARVVSAVATPSLVVAIWRFDNAQQRFAGYFTDPAAPSDLTALAGVDSVFVCVTAPTSLTAP